MKVINPATEELIATIEEDTFESIQSSFSALRSGQRAWSETALTVRLNCITRFADLLKSNQSEVAATLTAEVGKPLAQSRNEINGALSRINWMIANATKYLSDEIMSSDENMEERIVYEPLGVVCNISAWNYPLLVGVNVFVPALLAGNSVMYKPSEYATLTGLNIARLIHQAGVPQDAFAVAKGGKEVGEMLTDLPFDGYFFTGSYATGQRLFNKLAHKMVPVQCELGGKDPLYVAGDIADIRAVAAATADGAFYNNGQSCCAVERIYVHHQVYDQYIAAFMEEVGNFKIGNPLEPGVYLGPVTRKEQLSVLEDQVQEAISGGAKLLSGGKRIKGKGYYFEPTVLADVKQQMRVMQEESFGPVIGIMKVSDDEEAVALMNDTAYGLTASVYSSSAERADKLLRQLNSGTGYWNCCDRVSPALPWSGRKQSGFGSTLSHAGLRAFTRPKGLHLKKA